MPANDDLSLLINAARASGEIAQRFWKRSPKTWEKTGGHGPVTEADLAVDAMLRETLLSQRPDYGWLSEETEDTQERLGAQKVFIVDPIDGTRAFIEGGRTWAHSLAIADNGRVTAAVVFLPVKDRMFEARAGGGAFLNGEKLAASARNAVEGATVLAARSNFETHHWRDGAPPMQRKFRSSLAYRLSLVGQGRYDAMLTLRDTWEWDIAAGTLIVQEAGGLVTDKHSNALAFNNPEPKLPGVLAAGKTLHHALAGRLT